MNYNKIKIDSPSFTTHYLHMLSYATEKEMATGTGFIYEFENQLFLITNGHNVTGVNPEQNRRLNGFTVFPGKIKTKARILKKESESISIGITEAFSIDLYDDDDFKNPNWYIHPDKGYKIDVVAIPLIDCKKIPKNIKFFPINKLEFDSGFPPEVADDVFILGYPFNIAGNLELPVWKRGSIASEPYLDLDEFPKIFVDTATRPGMSGSPVIMQRTGLHGYNGKSRTGKEIIGTISNFVGIYSGRIGAEDEFKAQLGIIWKEKVILEILVAKKKSDTKFQMI